MTSGHGSELVTDSLSDLSLQGIVPAMGPCLIVTPSSLLLADLDMTHTALSLLAFYFSLPSSASEVQVSLFISVPIGHRYPTSNQRNTAKAGICLAPELGKAKAPPWGWVGKGVRDCLTVSCCLWLFLGCKWTFRH